MSTLKLTLVIKLFIFAFAFSSAAQISISGKIIDGKTGQPIPHVEVFISGTTKGCISDSMGNYHLKNFFMPCTLVADHVSYNTFTTVVRNKPNRMNITLTPSVISIDEVRIKSKSKRDRNLRFFYEHFLGEKMVKTKVLNDSVLSFKKTKMEFTATSKEPLIIENKFLGYRIKVILDEFIVYKVRSAKGDVIPLDSRYGGSITKLSGVYLYQPLAYNTPEKGMEYKKNREVSYFGSYRHFLQSLYNNDLKMQGFKIVAIPKNKEIETVEEISTNHIDSLKLQAKKFKLNGKKIELSYCFLDDKKPINLNFIRERGFYNYEISIIYPSEESFVIRENGTSPNINFTIDGPMAQKNFANSLPDDYLPNFE